MGLSTAEHTRLTLVQLQQQHRDLDHAVDKLSTAAIGRTNPVELQSMKKHKLWLQDEIARLKSALH